MEQNTQVFSYDPPLEIPGDQQGYAGPYGEDVYGYAGYEGYDGYESYAGESGYEPEYLEEDYVIYNDGPDSANHFHIAMNAFSLVSLLAGLVVIFALTTMIITLVSWIHTDITHSFVLLQSGIQ